MAAVVRKHHLIFAIKLLFPKNWPILCVLVRSPEANMAAHCRPVVRFIRVPLYLVSLLWLCRTAGYDQTIKGVILHKAKVQLCVDLNAYLWTKAEG